MKIELIEFDISELQQLEYGQFIKELLEQILLLPAGTITDVNLKTGIQSITDESGLYDKSMVKVTKNQHTQEVFDADAKRDHSFYALTTSISLGTFSEDKDEIKAARHLETLVKTYGGSKIAKYNYQKESNALDNLINDLVSNTYSSDVALIGNGKYVTRLKRDNEAFETIFSKRLGEDVGKTYYNAVELRGSLHEKYQTFVGYVLFNAKMQGEGQYTKVLEVINAPRKYYANLVAIRKGKKAAKKSKKKSNNAVDPNETPSSSADES